MIKAVIFDCDGLMFNTEYYAKQSWHNEAAKYGITLPEDFIISASPFLTKTIPGQSGAGSDWTAGEILPNRRSLCFCRTRTSAAKETAHSV